MNEADRNLLDAYLDDTLSPEEVERVDTRLCDEPALCDAFDTLRMERATRIAAFQSLTPGEEEADAFADGVLGTIHRQQRSRKLQRFMRIAGSVAACLIIGFAAGWFVRPHEGSGPIAKLTSPSLVSVPGNVDASAPVPALHPRSDVHQAIHTSKPAEPGQFQVAVLDDSGNVIAVQRFAKMEEARQFANDLSQYQARQQQVQDGQAMLVSDKF